MTTYGRKVLAQTGRIVQITSDGKPEWKSVGITIDWATVTAVSGADLTLADDTVVKIGAKALRFGTVLTRITATGKFGPYDSAAADGRQLLARGNVFLLNETTFEVPPIGFGAAPSDHPGVIEGGRVFKDRLLATTGTASLAAGPTFATLEAVLPRISYSQN